MRKKTYRYYRRQRSAAEKRANQEGWERPKRRPHLLPDPWDDRPIRYTRCWKDHRKTQYRGRGQKHTVYIDSNRIKEWQLKEHFKDHNIPYVLKKVWGRRRSCLHPIYQYWKTPTQPKYHYKYTTKTDEDGKKRCVKVRCHQIGWSYDYERITIGYKTCHYNYVKGHNLIWWSDKDIGIDYLLKRCKWE